MFSLASDALMIVSFGGAALSAGAKYAKLSGQLLRFAFKGELALGLLRLIKVQVHLFRKEYDEARQEFWGAVVGLGVAGAAYVLGRIIAGRGLRRPGSPTASPPPKKAPSPKPASPDSPAAPNPKPSPEGTGSGSGTGTPEHMPPTGPVPTKPPVPPDPGSKIPEKPVIDIWGEGRHSDAVNLNRTPTTTTTGAPGRPIPNYVYYNGGRLPYNDKSVHVIYLENAPIRPDTITEIARTIKPGGDIRLFGPATPEVLASHQRIADAVKGKIFQVRIPTRSDVGESVFTNIIVPER